MKKYKVLFFGGGKMGELVKGVLEGLENVEIFETKENVPFNIKENGIDLIFSASYPSRITKEICGITALGAVNLHTGLLPEGRGSHPLNWALIWGKELTGITIHKIVDTYDAGDICLQTEVPIFIEDNIVRLRERVEALTPALVQEFFRDPEMYIRNARQQNQAHASYAQKRLPEDGELNLSASYREQYNFIRAHDPDNYPAFVIIRGVRHNIRKATFASQNGNEFCSIEYAE